MSFRRESCIRRGIRHEPVLPTGSTQFTGANNQATGMGLVSNPAVSTTTLQYDAAGNLNGKNGATQSIYDAEGRLCATTSGTGGYEGYLYDAAGNRVAKGTITSLSCNMATNGFALVGQYLLGPSGEQMTELNGSGAWVHTNVTANGSLFATFDNDNKGVHFTLTDWLGTKRVQTNYLGAVEETCQGLPFGDALSCSGPMGDSTEHHFTGKERDAESGLDYFGARYYGSNMGRWMSPDWSAKAEPVPYAKLDNPQTLNLYAYVGNNPVSRTDPSGHYHCTGSSAQCAQFKASLDLVKQADKFYRKGSEERIALDRALKSIGKNNKAGPNIIFAQVDGGKSNAKTASDGSSITLDYSKATMTVANLAAGVVAHEGTHVADDKDPKAASQSAFSFEYKGHEAAAWTEQALYHGQPGSLVQTTNAGNDVELYNANWTDAQRIDNTAKAVTTQVQDDYGLKPPQ